MPYFTVCVLCYGEYAQQAKRCLQSIVDHLPAELCELHVILNACTDETRAVAYDTLRSWPGEIRWQNYSENRFKYPAMRDIFYAHNCPITTPFLMWLDDDSFLDAAFDLDRVHAHLAAVEVVGSRYHIGLYPAQQDFYRTQPWYRGRKFPARLPFPRGGWWCAHRQLLSKWDWPSPELVHRGGDVMFGALLFQQDIRWADYHEGVVINADMAGRDDKGKRRGGGFDPNPLGWNYRGARC